jgi:hypothetical protein
MSKIPNTTKLIPINQHPSSFSNSVIANYAKFKKENLTELKIDFHQLARNGELNTLDPQLLTAENLTVEKREKFTPFQFAIQNGHLSQIPKNLLTHKNLTEKNEVGITPLEWAVVHNQLPQIPYPILLKNKELCLIRTNIQDYEKALITTKTTFKQEISRKINKTTKT